MRRALMRTTSTKARRVGDVEVRLYGDDIDLKELWRRFLVLVGKPNGAANESPRGNTTQQSLGTRGVHSGTLHRTSRGPLAQGPVATRVARSSARSNLGRVLAAAAFHRAGRRPELRRPRRAGRRLVQTRRRGASHPSARAPAHGRRAYESGGGIRESPVLAALGPAIRKARHFCPPWRRIEGLCLKAIVRIEEDKIAGLQCVAQTHKPRDPGRPSIVCRVCVSSGHKFSEIRRAWQQSFVF